MGMSQMCTGAGDYFRTSKPHSEKLCVIIFHSKTVVFRIPEASSVFRHRPYCAVSPEHTMCRHAAPSPACNILASGLQTSSQDSLTHRLNE